MNAEQTSHAQPVPAWAITMRRLNNQILYDLGGGPRPFKFAWIVNTQKAGTFLFLGALMAFYMDNTAAATSTAAWVYLAMHGTYGLAWLVKDVAFPDPNWQVRITLPSSVMALVGLGAYWGFGWLLISGTAVAEYPLPDAAWFCLCVSVSFFGTVIMVAADAQKYFTLKVKKGLITEGMFRYIRHPNYLGEIMVYGGFALMVPHWFPWVVLAIIWGGLFSVNMVMKEASMSRYPQWAEYRVRTGWLLPWL